MLTTILRDQGRIPAGSLVRVLSGNEYGARIEWNGITAMVPMDALQMGQH